MDSNERALNEHLRSIDEAEAYDDRLAAETAQLMRKGEEYYPFSLANFGEALCEGCSEDADKAARLFEIADESNSTDLCVIAYHALNDMVKEYWIKLAAQKAAKIIEESKND